jgi:hypothetical protein
MLSVLKLPASLLPALSMAVERGEMRDAKTWNQDSARAAVAAWSRSPTHPDQTAY